MAASKKDIKLCFERWFRTLPEICAIESPWCFLCLAALIDYLSVAAYPNLNRQRDRYVTFIETFYPAKYKRFVYISGQIDLPAQMYYTLRNGLVHSFSLIPDQRSRSLGGRDRSIVLIHQSKAAGRQHLSQHSKATAPDAALFIAEDFLQDTKKAAYRLLRQAKHGTALGQAVISRFTDHPPVQWKA